MLNALKVLIIYQEELKDDFDSKACVTRCANSGHTLVTFVVVTNNQVCPPYFHA